MLAQALFYTFSKVVFLVKNIDRNLPERGCGVGFLLEQKQSAPTSMMKPGRNCLNIKYMTYVDKIT